MNRIPANRRREEEMEAFGRQPETAPAQMEAEEKSSIPFHYKMAPSKHKRLAELAKAEDRSMQWVLNRIVTEGLERWGKEGGTK